MRFLLLLAWFLPLAAWGQSTAITGKVTDVDDGMGLPESPLSRKAPTTARSLTSMETTR